MLHLICCPAVKKIEEDEDEELKRRVEKKHSSVLCVRTSVTVVVRSPGCRMYILTTLLFHVSFSERGFLVVFVSVGFVSFQNLFLSLSLHLCRFVCCCFFWLPFHLLLHSNLPLSLLLPFFCWSSHLHQHLCMEHHGLLQVSSLYLPLIPSFCLILFTNFIIISFPFEGRSNRLKCMLTCHVQIPWHEQTYVTNTWEMTWVSNNLNVLSFLSSSTVLLHYLLFLPSWWWRWWWQQQLPLGWDWKVCRGTWEVGTPVQKVWKETLHVHRLLPKQTKIRVYCLGTRFLLRGES